MRRDAGPARAFDSCRAATLLQPHTEGYAERGSAVCTRHEYVSRQATRDADDDAHRLGQARIDQFGASRDHRSAPVSQVEPPRGCCRVSSTMQTLQQFGSARRVVFEPKCRWRAAKGPCAAPDARFEQGLRAVEQAIEPVLVTSVQVVAGFDECDPVVLHRGASTPQPRDTTLTWRSCALNQSSG